MPSGMTYPLLLTSPEPDEGPWRTVMEGLEDFLGADEVPSPDSPGSLRLWFRSRAGRRRAISALRGDGGVTLRELPPEPPEDWSRAFRAFFRGVVAGGFFVHPPTVPGQLRLPSLLLTPGSAFGTGVHPTTRLAAGLLCEGLRRVRPSRRRRLRVLDIGTGSGILAVAAARLGVGRVAAVDVDPLAVAEARRTATTNGVGRQVAALEGDFRDEATNALLRRFAPRGFDWIVGNLTAALAPPLAAFAAPRIRRRGRLILSGFLRAAAGPALEACHRNALRIREVRAEPEAPEAGGGGPPDLWVAALLRRN